PVSFTNLPGCSGGNRALLLPRAGLERKREPPGSTHSPAVKFINSGCPRDAEAAGADNCCSPLHENCTDARFSMESDRRREGLFKVFEIRAKRGGDPRFSSW